MSEDNIENRFMIQKIFTKNISFESPNSPSIFTESWNPDLNLNLTFKQNELDEDTYEVILMITAQVTNNEKTAFVVEVEQAGIFTIQGTEAEQLNIALGAFCPSILYPYIREIITSEVARGGFPQLVLEPLNFDAIYFQRQKEKELES